MTKDSYVCPNCGFVLPKKDAVISCWDSQSCMHACRNLWAFSLPLSFLNVDPY
jgi:hypothetical protein